MNQHRWLLLVIPVFAFGCAGPATRVPALPMPSQPHLSIMTYNVNFGMAGDTATVKAVAQQDADVIFLQETTLAWEEALRGELSETYPHMAFKQHPPAGGLAVLSKLPIESIDYLPAKSWFPAARVVLRSPVGRVQVLNVHLRPPASDRGNVVSGYFMTPPIRRQEISTFAAALDPDLPTLIVGDFNEGEHGRAVKWLNDHGYRSALPEFSPGAKTWRWHTSVGTLRGRYDHLCYDKRLTPLRVEVRDAGQSDHLPVVGVFALARDVLPTTRRSDQQ